MSPSHRFAMTMASTGHCMGRCVSLGAKVILKWLLDWLFIALEYSNEVFLAPLQMLGMDTGNEDDEESNIHRDEKLNIEFLHRYSILWTRSRLLRHYHKPKDLVDDGVADQIRKDLHAYCELGAISPWPPSIPWGALQPIGSNPSKRVAKPPCLSHRASLSLPHRRAHEPAGQGHCARHLYAGLEAKGRRSLYHGVRSSFGRLCRSWRR